MNRILRLRSSIPSARIAGAIMLAAFLAPACLVVAGGVNVTVTTLVDENDGVGVGGVSLREAIDQSNTLPSQNNILIPLVGTITLTGPLPAITETTQIIGSGETSLIIDANSTGRPFFIESSANSVTLRDLEVRNGTAQGGNGGSVDQFPGGGGGGAGMGGAIFNDGASLNLENVTLRGNDAIGGQGGAISGVGTSVGGGGGGVAGAGGDGDSGAGGSGGLLGSEGQGGAGGVSSSGFAGGAFGVGGGGGGTADGGFDGGAGGFGAGGAGAGALGSGGLGGVHGGDGSASVGTDGGGGGGGGGLGGAVFHRAGTLSLSNVNFVSNNAMKGSGLSGGTDGEGKGGALYFLAGTIFDGGGHTFLGNTATDDVGAPGDDDHVFGTTSVPVGIRDVEVD